MLYISSILLMGIAFAVVRLRGADRRERADGATPQPVAPEKTLSITVTPVPPRPSALIIPFPVQRRALPRSRPAPRRA